MKYFVTVFWSALVSINLMFAAFAVVNHAPKAVIFGNLLISGINAIVGRLVYVAFK